MPLVQERSLQQAYQDLLHEFEFSVRWYEADTMLGFELAEFHTLMELAVINGDGVLSRAGK